MGVVGLRVACATDTVWNFPPAEGRDVGTDETAAFAEVARVFGVVLSRSKSTPRPKQGVVERFAPTIPETESQQKHNLAARRLAIAFQPLVW